MRDFSATKTGIQISGDTGEAIAIFGFGDYTFFQSAVDATPSMYMDGSNGLWRYLSLISSSQDILLSGAGKGYYFESTAGVRMLSGSGTPESSVSAPVGSLYLRSDGASGTIAYFKETGSGNTGWVTYVTHPSTPYTNKLALWNATGVLAVGTGTGDTASLNATLDVSGLTTLTGGANLLARLFVIPTASSGGTVSRFGLSSVSASCVSIKASDTSIDRLLTISGNAITPTINTTGAAANMIIGSSGANVNIPGTATVTSTLGVTGVITSSVATGTAPFTVASTTKVTNLNADTLDGLHKGGIQPASANLTNVAALTAQSLPSTIISVTENTQTGTTYTVLSTDNGKVVTLNNAGAITVTVPTLSAGFSCTFIQKGAGQVTFTTSGTTVSNAHSQTKTFGQYAAVTLYGLSSTTFVLAGDTGT